MNTYERNGRIAKTIESADLFVISSWKPEEAQDIYTILEHPNWAPWLEAGAASIEGRAKTFPAGQLIMKSPTGDYMGSLSLNQIDWDGNPSHLPTWDDVAGNPTDYSTTYTPHGNTLALLSMNVAPAWKGKHVPGKLIKEAQHLAQTLGIEHLIGSFRPSEYGKIKKGTGYGIDFETYCLMKRANSAKPVDKWLGSLWHMGMKMLAVDDHAMTVAVPVAEFETYKATYQPEMWEEIEDGVWECGEVGQWTVDQNSGIATYRESNVWGSLPLSG